MLYYRMLCYATVSICFAYICQKARDWNLLQPAGREPDGPWTRSDSNFARSRKLACRALQGCNKSNTEDKSWAFHCNSRQDLPGSHLGGDGLRWDAGPGYNQKDLAIVAHEIFFQFHPATQKLSDADGNLPQPMVVSQNVLALRTVPCCLHPKSCFAWVLFYSFVAR